MVDKSWGFESQRDQAPGREDRRAARAPGRHREAGRVQRSLLAGQSPTFPTLMLEIRCSSFYFVQKCKWFFALLTKPNFAAYRGWLSGSEVVIKIILFSKIQGGILDWMKKDFSVRFCVFLLLGIANLANPYSLSLELWNWVDLTIWWVKRCRQKSYEDFQRI